VGGDMDNGRVYEARGAGWWGALSGCDPDARVLISVRRNC